MSQDRKHIDDLLRDKFLSFEGDIDISDWDAIESRLNKKRKFTWIWWAAIPLLLIATLGFFALRSYNLQTNSIKKEELRQKSQLQDIVRNKTLNSDLENNLNKNKSTLDNNKLNIESATSVVKFNKTKFRPITNKSSKNSQSNLQNEEGLTYLKYKEVPDLWHIPAYKVNLSPIGNFSSLNLTKPKTKSKVKPQLSFEVGINISPAMGLDAIKVNKGRANFVNDYYFKSIKGSSSFGTGFNNGVNAQLTIGKNWYIRSGIYGTTYTVAHNYNYTIDSTPVIDPNYGIKGYVEAKDPITIVHNENATLKFVSIPFMFGNRAYIGNKFGIESKVGVNISRLVNSFGKSVNPTDLLLEDMNSNNSIKKWTTGLSISTGLFYKTNNNLIFTVEPNFNTLLGSAYDKKYAVKTRYYNYGVNLNVNYILKGGKSQ